MISTQTEISVSLQDIKDAQQRIKGKVNRTPLIRFYADDLPGEIYLKLENLQPIGSFKLRGAYNAISTAARSMLNDGVYTASAGNMASSPVRHATRARLSGSQPSRIAGFAFSAMRRRSPRPCTSPAARLASRMFKAR